MAFAREGIELEIATSANDTLGSSWSKAKRHKWLGDREFPIDVWKSMAALGWFDVLVSDGLGGAQLPIVEAAGICEAVGRHLFPGPVVDTLGIGGIARSRGLDVTSSSPICFLHQRPHPQPIDIQGGRISSASLYGEWADAADWLLVAVEHAVVIVNRRAAGVIIQRHKSPDMCRRPCRVEFDRAALTEVLAVDDAAADLGRLFRATSMVLATAEMVGVADRVVELSLEFASHRTQFGHPIATFQAVRHMLVDMKVRANTMRNVSYLAQVELRDNSEHADTTVMVAKAHASAAIRQLVEAALQVHGAVGLTSESDLGWYFLRGLTLQSMWADDRELFRRLGRQALEMQRSTTTRVDQ